MGVCVDAEEGTSGREGLGYVHLGTADKFIPPACASSLPQFKTVSIQIVRCILGYYKCAR